MDEHDNDQPVDPQQGLPDEPHHELPDEPVLHHRNGRGWIAGTAAAALVVVGAGVGIARGDQHGSTNAGGALPSSGQSATTPSAPASSGSSGSSGEAAGGDGQRPTGAPGGITRAPYTSRNVSTAATAAQQVGVVDIVVTLGYERTQAAGTGMLLTSNGEVLTNNHVINGATSIRVTVVTSGRTYTASVVGYDVTHDVAVLQLAGASGLATVTTASAVPRVGTAVVGVGNAGGAGGTPSAAAGKVVRLGQAITARDDDGSNPERLTGLIQTNAPIASGDSGGPLFNAAGEVIGMDTAISTGGSVEAYAIPISTALGIAGQIEAGTGSATVHVGPRAFLGVSLVDTSLGAGITGVVPGSPADVVGLQVGDVVTAIDGTRITSAAKLSTAMGARAVGDRVTIHWTDAAGQKHQGSVTLVAGPAK